LEEICGWHSVVSSDLLIPLASAGFRFVFLSRCSEQTSVSKKEIFFEKPIAKAIFRGVFGRRADPDGRKGSRMLFLQQVKRAAGILISTWSLVLA